MIVQEITERKRAEEALRKAKERTESVLNGITDIYMAFDRELRFTNLNARAEEVVGGNRKDLIGKSLLAVFPEVKNGELIRQYQKALSSQTPVHSEAVRSVVTGKWYETHVYPSTDGLSVYYKDITKRKEAEESLRKARDELEQKVKDRTAKLKALAVQLDQAEQQERRRVTHILHDDLQQVLVAARYTLDGLRKPAPKETHRRTVDEVDGILADVCQRMRSLCVEMHPPVLFEEGLVGSLKWLADEMKRKYGLAVKVVVTDKIDESSLIMLRTFVFNAIRELLLNVVKHGGVKSAEVQLGAADAESLQVGVKDKGVGFDPAQIKPNSFGLFSIRERADYLGGTMKIQSQPGKGSCITLTLPRI